jgi:hypothetical protein
MSCSSLRSLRALGADVSELSEYLGLDWGMPLRSGVHDLELTLGLRGEEFEK